MLCVLGELLSALKELTAWPLKSNLLLGSLDPWGNKKSAGATGATGAAGAKPLKRIPDKKKVEKNSIDDKKS